MSRISGYLSVGCALGTSLALASCAVDPTTGQPVGGISTPSITIPSISVTPAVADAVTQVRAAVVKACGYEATVESVASILSSLAGAPGVGDIVAMAASGICTAVNSMSARRGGHRTPTYRGVRIQGHFVGR